MTWVFHAQRAISKLWLDHDLQLSDSEITWTLSGPGKVTATVDAYTANLVASDNRFVLDEWSTFIYAEQNGFIEWGGILSDSTDAGNGTRTIDCVSFAGYPHGRIYTDELAYYEADAFFLIRLLWDYTQNSDAERSDIGVQVSNNLSNFIIGSADPGPMPVQEVGESDAAFEARLEAWQSLVNEPYTLAWWNTPDMGTEIDNIMSQARADYQEFHEWDDDDVAHRIELHPYGRVSRRTDLKFIEGENLRVAPQPERNGNAYANYMRGLGAGEDRSTLMYEAFGPDDGRLRRDGVYPAKNLLVPDVLAAQTVRALHVAQDILSFDTIEVVEHPNAPIGSWELGDEIFIQTFSGFEKLSTWMRIVEWSFKPDAPDTATIKLVKPFV